MSPTRRRFLGALPAAVAVAGCSGTDDTPVAGDGRPTRMNSAGHEQDPSVRKPRNPTGRRVILDPDADRSLRWGLIGTRERADRLSFAAGVPAPDAESARAFFDATDFSAQAVFVSHREIESCYRYRINSVFWEPGRIELEYCRGLRSPDVRCEADATEVVGICIRIPEPLEGELTGTGASGRLPCRNVDVEWNVIDGNATEDDG